MRQIGLTELKRVVPFDIGANSFQQGFQRVFVARLDLENHGQCLLANHGLGLLTQLRELEDVEYSISRQPDRGVNQGPLRPFRSTNWFQRTETQRAKFPRPDSPDPTAGAVNCFYHRREVRLAGSDTLSDACP